MPVNVPLLRETMEYIEAHPEEHSQSNWVCGTTMCFAGHAAVLSGAKVDRSGWMVGVSDCHVEDHAQRVLGLTRSQGNCLFYMARTVEDLRTEVDLIIKEAEADIAD